MTKMATMPIYGKNPLKIFFPGTSGPFSLKLDMKHVGIKSIVVYSNGDFDPDLFLWQGKTL